MKKQERLQAKAGKKHGRESHVDLLTPLLFQRRDYGQVIVQNMVGRFYCGFGGEVLLCGPEAVNSRYCSSHKFKKEVAPSAI